MPLLFLSFDKLELVKQMISLLSCVRTRKGRKVYPLDQFKFFEFYTPSGNQRPVEKKSPLISAVRDALSAATRRQIQVHLTFPSFYYVTPIYTRTAPAEFCRG